MNGREITSSPPRKWLCFAVLTTGLVLTAVITYAIAQNIKLRATQEFETGKAAFQAKIAERVEAYVALLRGLAGLYAVNKWVTEEEFGAYVERLRVGQFYPGLRGLGFSPRVIAKNKNEFFARLEKEGIHDFKIWPSNTNTDERFPIVYLKPVEKINRSILGFDLYSEPVRRAAMDESRDTGEPVVSGGLNLLDTKTPGFVVFVPVYQSGDVPDSPEMRRRSLEGFVYVRIESKDFVVQRLHVEDSPLRLEIYDGPITGEHNLLFRSSDFDDYDDAGFSDTTMKIGGRDWILRFCRPIITKTRAFRLLPLIPVAGVLVSLLLFYFTRREANAREEAQRALAELRKSEAALRESEERFRLIAQSAKDLAIFTLDIEGRISSWNPGAERILGYNEHEIIGQRSDMFFTDDDQKNGVPEQELKTAREQGQALDERWHCRHETERFFATGYMIALRDPDGKLRGYAKLMRDITESKKLEEALRESEERFRLLIESVKDYAIMTLDKEGKVAGWNTGAQRLFGYSEKEIVGHYREMLFTPEDVKQGELEKELRVAMERDQAFHERWHVRKDGSHFFASDYIVAMRDPNGNLRGFAKVVRDMTAQKEAEGKIKNINRELEDRVRQRTAALQESYEQMETFTYTVAHDLRAPLRAMQGFSQALNDDYAPQLDEAAQDYLSRIMRASHRMDTLIHDLLTYSQMTRADLQFQPVSLQRVVDNVLGFHAHATKEKNATVAVEGPLPDVLGHETTLETVISNLLGNALKFVTPDVSPRVQIRATEQNESGKRMVRLWVEDNGIGIAQEYQQRIFGIFERLHGAGTYAGTGVGLALVKKGIERMGGSVGVESGPGKGSKFWIELPAA